MVGTLRGHKAVVAKLGMDAHWRGAIVVANALRNAGMEVIYLGHASIEEIVSTVLQEDVALVGLSTLSGNHLSECRGILEGLRKAAINDVVVVLGGTIPRADEPALRALGIAGIFATGTPLRVITDEIAQLIAAQTRGRQSRPV